MTSQTLAPRQMYMELLSASVIDTNTFSSKSAAGGLLSRKLTSLQVYIWEIVQHRVESTKFYNLYVEL